MPDKAIRFMVSAAGAMTIAIGAIGLITGRFNQRAAAQPLEGPAAYIFSMIVLGIGVAIIWMNRPKRKQEKKSNQPHEPSSKSDT